MRKYRLNGWMMGTRQKAHRHIKKRLALPCYYGNNLDALCDCIAEMGEPATITLVHAAYMRKRLGDYGVKLLSALAACTGENPRVQLVVKQGW